MSIEVGGGGGGKGGYFLAWKFNFFYVNISNGKTILKLCIHRSFLNLFLFIVLYKGGDILHTSTPILIKIDGTGCEYFSLCESFDSYKCVGT